LLAGIGSSDKLNENPWSDIDGDILSTETLADAGYLLEGLGQLSQSLNNKFADIRYVKERHLRLEPAD